MSIDTEKYRRIKEELGDKVVLVAVSKTKPIEDIRELYQIGHLDFGENYVQELIDKQEQLPPDIRWHFIGHLQSNKVKFIAPFVSLIQGVDSYRLLLEINKQAEKCNRVIDCLLQVHIAMEDTKFGFNEQEIVSTFQNTGLAEMKNIRIVGLMGMASFTETKDKIRDEFKSHCRCILRFNDRSWDCLARTTKGH